MTHRTGNRPPVQQLKSGSLSSVGLCGGITGGIERRCSGMDLELMSDEREWRCGKTSESLDDVMPCSRVDNIYKKETSEMSGVQPGTHWPLEV